MSQSDIVNTGSIGMDQNVKSFAFIRIAASSLMLASTLAGCSGGALQSHVATNVSKGEAKAGELAMSAERSLAKRDAVTAITAAEGAVEIAPREASYRVLLGRAYLTAGRFGSAETALSDAMSLGAGDAKTVVSLALAKVASGKMAAARSLLAEHMDAVPGPDYGLAMAMAGDPLEGIRILSLAVQEPGAGAKERQNLAYAYALAGRWRDARMMAEADLSPVAAAQRVAMWAQASEADAAPYRVAALIGAKIGVADPGLPQQLALIEQSLVQIAVAEPSQPAPDVIQQPMPEAAIAAIGVPGAPVSAVTVRSEASPIRDSAPRQAAFARPKLTARIQTVEYVRPVTAGASNWVVQVGAYDSAAVAREKWSAMARSRASFSGFQPVSSTITVDGKLYHRLALSGFGGRGDAVMMCAKIRSGGGSCFVRQVAPEAKAQSWAAAARPRGKQIAMR
ncbi:SPOR domain-containing protein [Sphingobium sp. H39-3-25]|uniref:SPOR domain-containing protein n=1 Tax=Sphingobium arseniciresistens TaxID=3030834 RepID=UPI0023B9A137|nr:SPOR domain-containing protein [Sphingobium arseniciresistens]